MKQLTYNRAVALSIILAAAFYREHPDVKVQETYGLGTDFVALAKEKNLKSPIIDLLQDESERSHRLGLGISTTLNDITNFDHGHKLMKLFNGDEALENELVAKGATVEEFIESPYFTAKLKSVSKEAAPAQKANTKKKADTKKDEKPK